MLSLEQLRRAMPDVPDLERLWFSLMKLSVPHPEKEWASSRAYSTVDKQAVSLEGFSSALQEAEEALHEQITTSFKGFKLVARAMYDGDVEAAARRLIEVGEAEESASHYDRALKIYETALSLSAPLAEKAPQILALRRIGRSLLHSGHLDRAGTYYRRSADLARDVGAVRDRVIALTGCGNVHIYQGRWADAEAANRQALGLIEEADGEDLELEQAQVFVNLGTAVIRQGRLDEAETWFERALRRLEQLDSPVDEAICYHNLGTLRERQGRRSEEREVLLKALELQIPDALRSTMCTNLADSYLADGNMLEAEEWTRRAEKHAIASRSPYSVGWMYLSLGKIARAKGEEGGITFYEKALEIARGSQHLGLEAEVLLDYALLRETMGEVDEAFSYLQRARELFITLGAVRDRQRAEDALSSFRMPSATPLENEEPSIAEERPTPPPAA